MHLRNFGHDTAKVSEIGLGTWQLGGDWGRVDEATAEAILETAVASGINFFDTADVYGGGLSEERIGRFLKKTGAPVFVATKLGRGGDPGWPGNFERAAIRAHTEASLRRLGVDALDLTQLHCIPTEVLREGAVFDHLRELRDEGKIRRFGASVESMDQALLCLEQEGLASLQIIFNIFRQKPIDVLFDRARERGVAIIVRLPVASGLLTGKLTRETTFAPDDHRQYNRDGQAFNVGETFAGLPFELGVELAEALKPLVPAGMTMAQMALRWILDFEAVTTVIPGASRPDQVRANAAASDLPPLSRELHARLRGFYRTRVHDHIRGAY
ncbi:MAG: aldo/keto reductase [Verrucomicrobia bacterium]|nr:MAG: aldo/keto reductase [Verrucomicrobiota bacterium]